MRQKFVQISHLIFMLFIFILQVCAQDNTEVQDSKPNANEEIRVLTLDSKEYNLNEWFADTWMFQPGDNPEWASRDFDDTGWTYSTTLLSRKNLEEIDWKGIGWFRLHVSVPDEQLWNKPLALHFTFQTGASEIYLDGEKIYTFGKVGTQQNEEEPYWERDPKWITFSGKTEHVIAVRYSNFSSSQLLPIQGFLLHILPLNESIKGRVNIVRNGTTFQMVWTSIAFFLMLQHLLLFLFYPRARENLYFAITTGCLGAQVYLTIQFVLFATSIIQIRFLLQLLACVYVLMFLSAMLFLYTLFYVKRPKLFWFFLIGWLITVIISLFAIDDYTFHNLGSDGLRLYVGLAIFCLLLFTGLTFLEMARVFIVAILKKKDGAWIFGLGSLIPFILPIAIFPLVLRTRTAIGWQVFVLLIILCPLFSMSIYLARNFSRTSRKLETEELERKLLEVENTRKTEELEEARKLQMSMLPQTPPELSFLDVAFKMNPATEVGGDYYDYNISEEGELTIAIGDATGHGMNAGLVVSAVKSLFKTSNLEANNSQVLERISQGVKSMHLKRIYMAMTLAKFNEHKLILTAAGMPPPLVYFIEENIVEEILLEGMPLGGVIGTDRQETELELQSGDTILLTSDGLSEMLNPNDEMLGYTKTKELFEEVADNSPDEIIQHLFKACTKWADGKPQEDDITLVVIKMK